MTRLEKHSVTPPGGQRRNVSSAASSSPSSLDRNVWSVPRTFCCRESERRTLGGKIPSPKFVFRRLPRSTRLLSGGQMPFYCYLFSSSDGASHECQPSSASVIEGFIFLILPSIPPSLPPSVPSAQPLLCLSSWRREKGFGDPPRPQSHLRRMRRLLSSSHPPPLLPILPPPIMMSFSVAGTNFFFSIPPLPLVVRVSLLFVHGSFEIQTCWFAASWPCTHATLHINRQIKHHQLIYHHIYNQYNVCNTTYTP